MAAFFVTGSGTGVGKTYVAAALVRAWRSRGLAAEALKPVASGFNAAAPADSDTGCLLAALGRDISPQNIARISPWRYAEPLSPDMAAARERREVPYDDVVSFCREAVGRSGPDDSRLVIEGIGGVMVPLDDTHTVRDLVAALAIPALLVGGSYVGSLSHTLSAFEALRARRVAIERIVVSETPDSPAGLEESCAVLRRFVGATPVEPLPFGAAVSVAE